MSINLERCRSQNVSDNPRAWELIATHMTAESAIRDLWETRKVCRASGDQFRLTRDGIEVEPVSETEVNPKQ